MKVTIEITSEQEAAILEVSGETDAETYITARFMEVLKSYVPQNTRLEAAKIDEALKLDPSKIASVKAVLGI